MELSKAASLEWLISLNAFLRLWVLIHGKKVWVISTENFSFDWVTAIFWWSISLIEFSYFLLLSITYKWSVGSTSGHSNMCLAFILIICLQWTTWQVKVFNFPFRHYILACFLLEYKRWKRRILYLWWIILY